MHFAHIDPNTNRVTQVIVIELDVLEKAGGWPILGEFRPMEEFVETDPDGKIRKNYAGIGYEYHQDIDAFVPPRPFSSWVLDSLTGKYKAPKNRPQEVLADTDTYKWNEEVEDWEVIKNVRCAHSDNECVALGRTVCDLYDIKPKKHV